VGSELSGRLLSEPDGVTTGDGRERKTPCGDAVVTDRTLTRARAGDEEAFRQLTEPHRRELQLHCYRIVGSVQDAEDLLQETLLAAWRGLDRFEGRASLRAWLYRIATNRCLNALRDAGRRPRNVPPPPEASPMPPEPTRQAEPIWLEPYPDVLVEGVADRTPGPEARYEVREAIGLAFVAGLQHLPPRQRGAVVLRDVLGFKSAEVADMLGSSEASVNSALQRARSALDARLPAGGRENAPLPRSAAERALVGRFADAFESGDVDGVIALLTDDAWLTMPPEPLEYQGGAAIGRFLSTVPAGGALERLRLVATRANSQPAFACYLNDPVSPIARAYGLMVLTLEGDRVSAITGFPDTSVFPHFGLPRTLRA
jgi:RNA polymerase sigma-70 factor (TIGR02960 family)